MAMSQIPTLRTHIWQTKYWQIYPPIKWQFHRFLLWEFIFGRSGLDISTPIPHSVFMDSYSENSYLADQILVDPSPLPVSQMTISQIPTLRGSYLADQVLGDLPSQMAISQIPTLGTHISQVRSGHIFSYPPQWFHRLLLFIFGRPDLPTPLRAHIWQTRS